MTIGTHLLDRGASVPSWLPEAARHYIAHTEDGTPIREIARRSGVHASTILRQIRKFESRRDDPLIDSALRQIGAKLAGRQASQPPRLQKKVPHMPNTALAIVPKEDASTADTPEFQKDALRVLRRLCETGAVLAVAADMEKAVVVREGANGTSTRTGVVDRATAEVMALRDWIQTPRPGRVSKYAITRKGRAALDHLFEALGAPWDDAKPPAEDANAFAEQHRVWGEKRIHDPEQDAPKTVRYNVAESPLAMLARRRDKTGTPFLSDALVAAGERLREDFELAHMGPRIAQNWDKFLTGGDRGGFQPDAGVGTGPEAARRRVQNALGALGPGLADVVLRCCCYLEGVEAAQRGDRRRECFGFGAADFVDPASATLTRVY